MYIHASSSRASDETSGQVGDIVDHSDIDDTSVDDMIVRLEALEQGTRCGHGSIFQFDIGMYSQLKELASVGEVLSII